MRILKPIVVVVMALGPIHIAAQMKSHTTEVFKIQYEECAEAYVEASVKVLEFVRQEAMELGFEFPRRIQFNVLKSDRNRLYFGKKNPNTITWEFASPDDFQAPDKSGYNNVYGLCHELGHICMFNITPHKNNWMTRDYREGWADYFANMMVDSLFRYLGTEVWPDGHNYLEYAGMQYFENRLVADKDPQHSGFNYASQFWYNLSHQIGPENLSSLFRSVRSAKVRNPGGHMKLITVVEQYVLDPEFISDLDKNIDYLVISN